MTDRKSDTTERSEHFERGVAAALAGEPWPQRPTRNSPWREWEFWHGYRHIEIQADNQSSPDRELLLRIADAVVELLGHNFDDREMVALRLEIGYRSHKLRGLFGDQRAPE